MRREEPYTWPYTQTRGGKQTGGTLVRLDEDVACKTEAGRMQSDVSPGLAKGRANVLRTAVEPMRLGCRRRSSAFANFKDAILDLSKICNMCNAN